MRDAPPVTLPAGRSPFEVWLPLGLACAGLALTGLWAWEARGGPAWPPVVGLLAWLVYGRWVWVGIRKGRISCGGELAWDGEGWYWRGAAVDAAAPDAAGALAPAPARGLASWPVQPEVCLDLQRLLLVRLSPLEPPEGPRNDARAGPQRWLWLTPGRDPGRWRALRRALYSIRSRPAQ